MGKLAEHYVEIGARLDKFRAGMAQVEKRMASVGQKMTAVGKKMTRYVTLPILAIGVAAVKAGADFEYAMTNAWAVTGEGEKALVSMTAKAREMGATTIFSARQAADAMYFMASAGWDSKKMAEAIKPTLDLAAATQSDLAFATEAVIATMNQFQITTKDTGKVTNVFAAAIMGSQATLEKLKISMSFIGPLAHSLGYEIEGTTATLMGLYNAGFEASTAGTALRMALAKLALGTGATKEGLKGLGLSIEDVNPEIYSMAEIIRKLEERGATATDVIKIFGVRAGPAMASLIAQGADQLDRFKESITGTNRAAEMAEKQLKTFKGSFKLLISIINEASIQIFAVLGPIIKDLIDNKIRPAIKAFTELTEGKKKLILKIAGLAAALGPLLLIFGALTTTIIPAVITGIMGLATAMVFLATNPAGMVLVAIGAIVAILLKLRWEQYKTAKEMEKFDDAGKASARHVKKAIELAGLSEEAYIKLRKAYGGNTQELMKAILAGTHEKDLQFALIKVLKEAKEKREELRREQAAARKIEDDATKRIRDMNEEMKRELELFGKLKDAAILWAERLKELGVETIPDMEEKIGTLTGEIGKLDEMFETGEIGVTDYYNTISELREEIDRLKTKIEETLPPARDFADVWELMGPKIEGVKGKIGEAAISIVTVSEVFNSAVLSMGENLLNWGDMTGNVLKNITKIFGTFIQEMIKGFGKLVIAQLLQAKKSILISKAETIAKAIAKVFAKVPFPLNIAIAGTMFGVVGALFSKLMPKLGGGGWIPRPMLVEAGHGPRGEIIAQPSKLAEIISKEMPAQTASPESPMGFNPVINLTINARTLDRDTVRRAGELIYNELGYQKNRRRF